MISQRRFARIAWTTLFAAVVCALLLAPGSPTSADGGGSAPPYPIPTGMPGDTTLIDTLIIDTMPPGVAVQIAP